jgi:hypothetical protein
VLKTSGYIGREVQSSMILDRDHAFLQKPYSLYDLLTAPPDDYRKE